jgi:hypothetical protein
VSEASVSRVKPRAWSGQSSWRDAVPAAFPDPIIPFFIGVKGDEASAV